MFKEVYQGTKVLVTGHTGFKGSWLSQWLLLQGAKVAGLSLDVPTRPSHYQLIGLGSGMAHYTGDVRNPEVVRACMNEVKPDIVFHLAAQPLVRAAYDQPRLTFETNLGGMVNVMEAIRGCPSVRAAVIITSDKCYENIECEHGYSETDRLGGKDPYSASKACAEIAFSCYARSYFSSPGTAAVATGRAGNVIGGGDWAADRIVPDCVRAWTEGRRPQIRSPKAVRPWQHVLEPLSAYLWLGAGLLAGDTSLRGESFNFGPASSVTASVEDLLHEIATIWRNAHWDVIEAQPGAKSEASLLKLNCDKAARQLQWEAVLSFAEAAAMTARWYLDYHEAKRQPVDCTVGQIHDYERLAIERRHPWARS